MDLIATQNNIKVREDIINQNRGYNASDRYTPIPTTKVLDIIREIEPNYTISGFNNSRVRNIEKESYQKHVLFLTFENSTIVKDTSINMVIFNSHDKSMSLRLMIGSIRGVCSNNIVWGNLMFPEVRIRHTKKEWEKSIYELMNDFRENQNKVQNAINKMMNRSLSFYDMHRFANRAVEEIIQPTIKGEILDPSQMLVAQRKEDIGKDLWRTFNKVQEYMIKGGIQRITEDGKISNTHKITDNKKIIEMNRKLTDMAIEYI